MTTNSLNPKRDYSSAKKLMAMLSMAFLYFLLGWNCLKLATINQQTSPFWLPSGLALGGLFYFGRWLTPGVFLGAFLVNLTVASVPQSLGFALGNTVEAVVGCSILMHILRKNYFNQYSELFALLCASLLSPIISASIGTALLYFQNILSFNQIAYSWFTWWSGDFVGIMVLLPMALYFCQQIHTPSKRPWLAVLFVSILLSYTSYIFIEDFNQSFAWTLCPLLILAGSLFGNLISRIILIILSLTIVFLTKIGHGPFEYGNLNVNFLFMQCLIACCSIGSLFVRLFESEIRLSRTFLSGVFLGWCCIFLVIFSTSKLEKKYLLEDLRKSVNGSIDSLEKTLSLYTHLIESGKAVFVVNPNTTASEWRQFAETIKLEEEFHAINGFGFVKYSLKDKNSHSPNIKYWDKAYADQFQDQFIITYLEPHSKNSKAIGFDIGSDPLRRSMAEEAMKLNQAGSSPPIKLVQDTEDRRSFAIYNPIWLPQEKKFLGWIVAPVVSEVFFASSLKSFADILKVSISHKGQPIHRMGKSTDKNSPAQLRISKTVMVFGQPYDFEFYPTTRFLRRHVGFTIPLALLLNIFMLFVTGFLIEQLSFGQKAEKLVQKRTEELEESKIQLIHSSKMASLGEMAGGMAHEINNPLTIIQGKVKILSLMMEDNQMDKPFMQEEIQKIKFTADRIGKIVRGLRTFSRASDNDPFERTQLNVIFKETLDLCSEKFKFYGVNLEISPIPPVQISCRPSQISQVLLNLFNNANDAVELLSEKWIRVDFKQTDQMMSISITDSGPGIPMEVADKIMEPFFTTKEVGKGTGLGLSITKGIIEAHKGKFWYNKNSPHTQFIIELPIES